MHLVASLVALAAALGLVRRAQGSRAHAAALTVYVGCLVAGLAISGTYHALARDCVARTVMRRLDYMSIWLLIAGTFTAVHGIMFKGFWRSGMLTIIWGYAAIGLLLQVVSFATFSGWTGLVLYLGMGWVGTASIVKLRRVVGARAVRPLWFGGLAFSSGAIFEALGYPVIVPHWIGPHEVFHLAVVVGLTSHWIFIRGLLIRHVYAPASVLAPAWANEAVVVPAAL